MIKRVLIDTMLAMLLIGVLVLPISTIGWAEVNTNTATVLSNQDFRPDTTSYINKTNTNFNTTLVESPETTESTVPEEVDILLK